MKRRSTRQRFALRVRFDTAHICHFCGLPCPPDFEFDMSRLENGTLWAHPDCFAYTTGYGETPGRTLTLGQRLTQTCGNPRCVNPKHLEIAPDGS